VACHDTLELSSQVARTEVPFRYALTSAFVDTVTVKAAEGQAGASVSSNTRGASPAAQWGLRGKGNE